MNNFERLLGFWYKIDEYGVGIVLFFLFICFIISLYAASKYLDLEEKNSNIEDDEEE